MSISIKIALASQDECPSGDQGVSVLESVRVVRVFGKNDGCAEARVLAGGDPDRLSLDLRVSFPVAGVVRLQSVLLRAQHYRVSAEQRSQAACGQSQAHPAAG